MGVLHAVFVKKGRSQTQHKSPRVVCVTMAHLQPAQAGVHVLHVQPTPTLEQGLFFVYVRLISRLLALFI